jgi:hypothetical protein
VAIQQQVLETQKEKEEGIPEEFRCSLCRKLMKDPLLIACCGYSFCAKCIRPEVPTDILICPNCKRESDPSKLVSNINMKNAIDKYKIERKAKKQQASTKQENETTAAVQNVSGGAPPLITTAPVLGNGVGIPSGGPVRAGSMGQISHIPPHLLKEQGLSGME